MSSRLSIIARATATLGVLVAAVGGVTYAQLTSNTATLSDNTVTGTASLLIADPTKDAKDPASFSTSVPGYKVTNFVPGKPVEGPITVKNTGDVPLNVSVKIPLLPAVTGFSGWENGTFVFTATCANGNVANANFTSLNNPGVAMPCGPLPSGESRTYTVKFNVNPESVSGNTVDIKKFDLAFSGEASTN